MSRLPITTFSQTSPFLALLCVSGLFSPLSALGADDPIRDRPSEPKVDLAPPTASAPGGSSDSVFGKYSSGDLDDYICWDSGDGSIDFTIPIDRVISRDKTDWSEIIQGTPTLRMRVWDVDASGNDCNEVDDVYLNDVYVGSLNGANDSWSEFNIDLPVSYFEDGTVQDATFNDAGVPPTPGLNHIRIPVDTAGCESWCVTVDYAEISVDAVRPVTFIHGILSDSSTWATDQSLVPGNNSLAYDVGARSSTAANAAKVVADVGQTTTAFGTDKTNMVCHSKGGLDTEWASLIAGSQMETITTLGSPLQGSEMADHFLDSHWVLMLLSAYWGSVDVAVSLKTTVRDDFYGMLGSTVLPGVDYYRLAGTIYGPTTEGCPLNALHLWNVYPFSVSHDGYVASDHAYPPGSSLNNTVAVAHVDMTGNSGIWDWTWANIVASTASGSSAPPSFSPPTSTTPPPTSTTEAVLSTHTETLSAGDIWSDTVSLDSSVQGVSFTVYADTAGFDISVIDPAGNSIGEAEAAGDPNISYVNEEVVTGALYAVSIQVLSSDPGSWTVTVTSTDGGEMTYSTAVLTTLTVDAATDATAYLAGDTVTFLANLVDDGVGIEGATGIVSLIDADSGAVDTATLSDSGGGNYEGTWTADAGTWVGEVTLSGTDSSGYAFERSAGVNFVATSAGGSIGGVVDEFGQDTDGNGRYDTLVLSTELTIDSAGDYQVLGVLTDESGSSTVSTAGVSEALAVGTNNVLLSFDGEQISEARLDGPYLLHGLLLIDEASGATLDSLSDGYTTDSYFWYDFDGPELTLLDGSDSGVDRNGNGLYDQIEIDINVDVTPGFEGIYTYNAQLLDADGGSIAWYSADSTLLDSGTNSLSFFFDTDTIYAGAHPSPYTLSSFYLYDSSDPSIRLSASTAYQTGMYCSCSFDAAPSDCVNADVDSDGFAACEGDCDDNDATISPDQTEICDTIDNNCDGEIDEGFDEDLDGYTTCGGDCDDGDFFINPGAAEVCNLVDDNCDDTIDENFDIDGDGATSCGGDCDDNDATISPLTKELCDNIDNNCDGSVDEGFDADGDGYRSCDGDCDDNDATVWDGADEICDGVDNNCDGQVDEGCTDTGITDGGGTGTDGGSAANGGTGKTGCGCATGGTGQSLAWPLLLALIGLVRRRQVRF